VGSHAADRARVTRHPKPKEAAAKQPASRYRVLNTSGDGGSRSERHSIPVRLDRVRDAVSKPPSWNQIRSDAAAFAARWADDTDEAAEAQSFWTEFLAIFGVDRKRVAIFEKRAERLSTGGRGRIDVFWPGVLIAEHKSAGKDLDAAEAQAIDYLESIDQDDFPGLLVVSDFARMRITDLGGDRIAYEFPLTDLPKEIDRFAYLAGYSGRQLKQAREHEVDIAAARLMGSLYEKVAESGFTDHETSVFLVRMLFVLFGDDTGLWEKSLFLEFLETRTQPDGSDLGPQIALLFQTLDRPEDKRPPTLDELLARFPYVNGGLFADRLDIPSFNQDIRQVLIGCCHIDWGSIVPAIFGSLFQAVKSKEDRRLLGEHYTTEANILRTIGPLFLDDLRNEYESAFHDVKRLNRLRGRLGELRIFDPACGCGNFLVIAYRELRQLELDILVRLRELTGEEQLALDATLGLKVSLSQFYGIELEEWPARIAETALFLMDHQSNQVLARTFGQAPDRLPIGISADIRVGNAIDIDWNDVLPASDEVRVCGNPPFIGMSMMGSDQQTDNRTAFAAIETHGLKTGRLDYVACWYAKTIGYLSGAKGRAAFVSTNSITQGEQARTLLPLLSKSGYEIDFAHRTFKWTSEAPGAAAVHVVIIGFSPGGQAKRKRLFDYPDITAEPKDIPAEHINFYLLDGPDLAPAKRNEPLIPGLPTMTQGSKPWDGGSLLVSKDQYPEVASDPIAAEYLRKFIGATEMLHSIDRYCLWLKNAKPSDIRNSPQIRQRLKAVAESRLASPTVATQELAKTPGIFAQDRQPTERYLAIPKVSGENRDYIPAAFYNDDVIAGDAVLVVPGCQLWLFGFLQSRAFMAWVDTYSGRLGSSYQLLPGLVYFSFPFIEPEGQDLQRIERAAQAVLDARAAYPDSNLADLYDPLGMPADLRAAHRSLDTAVDALYGLIAPTEAERLQALLARYQRLQDEGTLPGLSTNRKKTVRKRAAKA
jgi:hypothetical protein